MRASRPYAAAIAVMVGAVLLSGCTVRIIDPGGPDAGSTASPSVRETSAAQTPEDDEPDQSTPAVQPPETSPVDGWDAEHAEHRQRLSDSVTTTMPCPTAPLQQDGTITRIEGDCDEVRIDLDAGAVIIDDAASLLLSGSGTVVYADTLGDVRVSGTANEIYWLGATPQVTDTGTANVLRRG